MLAIRSPGPSGPVSRSASPSMLFRCRSRPGRKSPEPSPRLVVSTHALPSRVDTRRGSSFPVCERSSSSSAPTSASARSGSASPRSAGSRSSAAGKSDEPAAGQQRDAAELDARPARSRRASYAVEVLARDEPAALLHQLEQRAPDRPRVERSAALRRRAPRAQRTSPGCRSVSPSSSSVPPGAVDLGALVHRHHRLEHRQAGGVRRGHRHRSARKPQRGLDEPRPGQAPVLAPERVRAPPERPARRTSRSRPRSGRAPSPNGTSSSSSATSRRARRRARARRRSSRGCDARPMAASK